MISHDTFVHRPQADRQSFRGHIPEVTMMPNLIEVQRTSYENFLQMNLRPAQRDLVGAQEVLESVFPIRDFAEHGGARLRPV